MKVPRVKLLSGDIYIIRPAHKHSTTTANVFMENKLEKKQAHFTHNASLSKSLPMFCMVVLV